MEIKSLPICVSLSSFLMSWIFIHGNSFSGSTPWSIIATIILMGVIEALLEGIIALFYGFWLGFKFVIGWEQPD
jgi:hypothetical protein